MRKPILLLLLLTAANYVQAQSTNNRLSGTLIDERREYIIGATVAALNHADTVVVETTQSNDKGEFRFLNLKAGVYLLRVSFTGYKIYYSFPINLKDSRSIYLTAIVLNTNANVLQEVKVVSKRRLIEQDIDKKIVNVDAMVGSASNNTLEVLAKTPGVTVDENGVVNLNGKNNVLVLIDGRATYMSPQDLSAYLKALPGGMLDKIELIDNPSSKYEAEGNAVINIRLKKSKRRGFTGTLSSGISQGTYFRTNQFLNLNYNTGKVNWFGSLGYSKGSNYGDKYSNRISSSSAGFPFSEIQLSSRNTLKNNSYLGRLGVDFKKSPNTTLGFLLTFNCSPRTEANEYNSLNIVNGRLDTVLQGNSLATIKGRSIAFNVNYLHKFNSIGSELTTDVNYIRYSTNGNQPFVNYATAPGGPVQLTDAFKYGLQFNSSIYNFKTDYLLPIQKKFVLEAGVKTSLVQNDNDFRQFNLINNQYSPDLKITNDFLYDENINSGYVNIKRAQGRFRWQLGMRIESSRLKGNQLGNDTVAGSRFTQDFTDIFPSLFLSYKLDTLGKTNIQLNVSKKINRPNYYQYNPFLVFNDRYSYTSGNPSLQSTYPLGIVLTLQHNQFLTIRAGYGKKSGLISQSIQVVDKTFYSRPENVGKEEMYFSTVGVNFSARPWWYMNYNFQFRHFVYSGIVYGQPLLTKVNRVNATLLNQFTLSKTVTADLLFDYTGKDFDNQAFRLPRYNLTGSIQKKIWNGKGSLAIGFEDLFHSLKTRYEFVNTKSVLTTQTYAFDSRRFRFGFTYNFGSERFQRKSRHKDDAAEPETQRVNN